MKTYAGGQVEEITDFPYRKLTEVRQVVLLLPASLSLPPLCEDVASVDVGEDYSVSLKL